MNNPPQWCQSTRGVSETRLAIRFERQSGLLRHFKERGTLYLDIFDYPGEWLLDLPLLNLDFQQLVTRTSQNYIGYSSTVCARVVG